MIPAQSLRIGNLILDSNGLECEVFEIKPHAIRVKREGLLTPHIDNETAYLGIPLTSDILIRLGFEEGEVIISTIIGKEKCYWKNDCFVLIRHDQNTFFGKRNLYDNYPTEWIAIIFYTHELMNLYFCVRGEELTLSNNPTN